MSSWSQQRQTRAHTHTHTHLRHFEELIERVGRRRGERRANGGRQKHERIEGHRRHRAAHHRCGHNQRYEPHMI